MAFSIDGRGCRAARAGCSSMTNESQPPVRKRWAVGTGQTVVELVPVGRVLEVRVHGPGGGAAFTLTSKKVDALVVALQEWAWDHGVSA